MPDSGFRDSFVYVKQLLVQEADMKRFISLSLGILAVFAMSAQAIWAADPVQTQDREQLQTQTRSMQGGSAGQAEKQMQHQNRNQNRAAGAGSAQPGGQARGQTGGKSGKGR